MVAVIAMLAGITANWLIIKGKTPAAAPQLKAGTALFGQTRPLPQFSLLDQNGQPFNNDRLQNRWSFFFFGYTHCPDICPMTLATLATMMKTITSTSKVENTQVIFVSVDPERDTQPQLKTYVEHFNPKFIGVTGDPAAIDKLTSNLGILHVKTPNPNDPNNYLVDHTASILLVGPSGHIMAIFGAPHEAHMLAEDFHTLNEHSKRI